MSSPSTGGTEGSSPASSPASATSLAMAAPKYGTLVPNRIFVGGISANTSEAELAQLFSAYGNVKATKIISDRAGVSKGYGFVTFETEEEAKRLQTEPDCIILRERKLNIAPAIKKQPFNRSFDNGSGSPPAVPTSTFYYANGVGLTYQNGMTFYNPGAPAPGTPIAAPPTDPTSIYQAAAGVFGPQAAAGHQTFAPVMYPCPAPSLYMPQQYQYSPMPYEPYYTGAPTAGTSPYMYATSTSHSTTNNGGNGSGSNGNGITGTASPSHVAAPPPSLALPPPPAHFYAPAAAPPPQSHHHPSVPTAGPSPQDHLYYSFAAGPPPPPQPHTLGLAADQQLLFYTADTTCQQQPQQQHSVPSDTQSNQQEDSHSTSSHSEQPHSETQTVQPVSGPTTPLVPLMPVKYPMSGRYGNYHPIAIHTTNIPNSTQPNCLNESDDCNAANQMQHCRTIVYPATALYIHPHAPAQFHSSTGAGASLLPTPPPTMHQPYDMNTKMQNVNSREYSKAAGKPQNGRFAAHAAGVNNQKSYNAHISKHSNSGDAGHNKYPNIYSTPPSSRISNYHYGKRCGGGGSGGIGWSNSHWYLSQKTHGFTGSAQGNHKFGGPNANYNTQTYSNSNYSKQTNNAVGGHNLRHNNSYPVDQYSGDGNSGRLQKRSNQTRPSNLPADSESANKAVVSSSSGDDDHGPSQAESKTVDSDENSRCVKTATSPPPTAPASCSFSPTTRPVPNLSPNATSQVQFYATVQNRYQHHQQSSSQQQQQQRRYTVAQNVTSNRKSSDKYASGGSVIRQTKHKMNGIMQVNKMNLEDSDMALSNSRMPITPPGTPRSHSSHLVSEQNQVSETCHNLQALSL